MTDDTKAPADPADAVDPDVPARPGLPDRVWIPMLGAALAGLPAGGRSVDPFPVICAGLLRIRCLTLPAPLNRLGLSRTAAVANARENGPNAARRVSRREF